jgi:A/G-specific adenine glycosylase
MGHIWPRSDTEMRTATQHLVAQRMTLDEGHPLLTQADWRSLRMWYSRHGRHSLPWRRNRTHWRILVAEVLLRRTRAGAVNRVFDDLLNRFPDARAVVLDPDGWREAVRSLGLGIRVDSFVKTCRELTESHQSLETMTRWELEKLPGVGHYIATAVRCFAGSDSGIVVDSNTIRIAGRLVGAAPSQAAHRSRSVQRLVGRLSPDSTVGTANDNFGLLDLGALVCHVHRPDCSACVLRHTCVTGQKSVPGTSASD